MSFTFGNSTIGDAYFGAIKIGSAYQGSTLVYTSVPPVHVYNYYWLDINIPYGQYNGYVSNLQVNNSNPTVANTYLYDDITTYKAVVFSRSYSETTRCFTTVLEDYEIQNLITNAGYDIHSYLRTLRIGFTSSTIPTVSISVPERTSLVLYGSDTPYMSSAVKLSSTYAIVDSSSQYVTATLTQTDTSVLSTPYTLRFHFSSEYYNPTNYSWKSGATWTQVSYSPNIWDYTHESSNWDDEFNGKFINEWDTHVAVIAAGDMSGVTSMKNTAYVSSKVAGGVFGSASSSNVSMFIYICDFDTSNVTNLDGLFYGCSYLQSFPTLNTSSCTSFWSTFDGCNSALFIPQVDLSHTTSMRAMYSKCFSLLYWPDLSNVNPSLSLCQYCFERNGNVTKGITTSYNYLSALHTTNHTACFNKCGLASTISQSELTNVPSGWK